MLNFGMYILISTEYFLLIVGLEKHLTKNTKIKAIRRFRCDSWHQYKEIKSIEVVKVDSNRVQNE